MSEYTDEELLEKLYEYRARVASNNSQKSQAQKPSQRKSPISIKYIKICDKKTKRINAIGFPSSGNQRKKD
ncbi:MAG: hypothetical protein LBD61_00500 [Endomicrobium sp.]|jgi:hypothetical protein|nr:hypothetical protein [Endomicrobium sp.]